MFTFIYYSRRVKKYHEHPHTTVGGYQVYIWQTR